MPIIRDFTENFLERLDGLNAAQQTDFERLKELLNNTPAGAKFIGNQALLAQSTIRPADIIQDPISGLTDIATNAVGTAAQITAILAQVRVNGTGTHFLMDETGLNTYLRRTTAAAEAKYTGTINIRRTRKMRGEHTLDSYYNSDPNRNKGVDVYDPINSNISVSNEEDLVKDLLPFYFKIQGVSDNRPVTSQILQFRGFLEGEIADNFTGDWTATNYVGRGESFYSYNTFVRNFSFSFKTAAFASSELENVTGKLNMLASTTAPSYSSRGFMQGTLIKVTIGDYVKDVLGKVDSVSINSSFDSPWDITPGTILPMVASVNVSFTPIHNFIPTVSTSTGPYFIGN